MMKVPDPRVDLAMSLLRGLSSSRIGELAENCGTALSNIAKPLAISISLRIPELGDEFFKEGGKSNLSTIENAVKNFRTPDKNRSLPNSITIRTNDDKIIAIAFIKHLGNPIGEVAAIGNESQSESIAIPEAVWLCASQMGLRINSLLSPESPTSSEIMGRRLLAELSPLGIIGIGVTSSSEDTPGISLLMKDGKISASDIEPLPQKKLLGIDDGEIIEEGLLEYIWPGVEMPGGVWMATRPEHYVAVGLADKKLVSSQIIGKIKEAIEKVAVRDSEYLVKSFEKLKSDFKKLVKSERAAAITETAVTINHEINNPLTAILGNTQLLLMSKDKLPADVVNKLETIERSAIKIRETTSKLMAIIEPVTTPYASGLEMIDIEKSKKKKNH